MFKDRKDFLLHMHEGCVTGKQAVKIWDVIRAARALVHEQRHGDEASVAAAEWKLAKAVEALDSEEG